MDRALRLLFNIHPGEGAKSFLFIVLGLMWSIGTYGMFTLSEGLFLEHVGAQGLPLTYVLVSLSMCLLSTLLLSGLKHFSIKNLLLLLISFWAVMAVGLSALYPLLHSNICYWYAFKVIGWMMPISTYICYWSFIDQFVDLQDGKRLFSIINSVTFLGDAIGSGLISFTIRSLGFRGLVGLYASLMVLAVPIIFYICGKMRPLVEAHHDHIDSKSNLSLKEIIKKVFTSRFTLSLLGFYFIMQVLLIVVEFNYMSRFASLLGGESEYNLAEFLGRCNMWIALGNMVLGLFVYSRLVRRIGVQNLVVVAPTFCFCLFCLWFWQEGLSLAVLGLIGREGIAYTFDDNNLNLLISAVPSKIKNQMRITVESFFEPVGMLFGASMLFLFQHSSPYLGLVIALIACAIVWLLRSEYPKAIFSNLVANSIRFEKTALDWIPKKERRSFEFHLLSSLKLSDEESRLLAFEYLLKMGNDKHLLRLLNQVNLLSIPGKLKAIELLSNSCWATEATVIEKLERWRRTVPHPVVRSAIHFYFARHSLLRPERMMQDLHHEHLGFRAAAILSLKTSPYQMQLPSFYTLASEKLSQLLESKLEKEICMGLEILGREKNPENVFKLLPYLKHPNLNVKKSAAQAVFYLASPSLSMACTEIINTLTTNRDPDITLSLLKALEIIKDPASLNELILATIHFRPSERIMVQKIALQMENVSEAMLLEMLQNRFVHERCRLMAGKLLARLNPPLLKRHLFPIVQSEIERAYFYYYHLETVSKHDQPILQNALETGYHTVIDFIIQLIGAADALEECEVLSHSLRSRNQKIRAQAIETLQKACNIRLFSLIEPLIDERSSEKKTRHYLKRGFIPLKLGQLLDTMAYSPSLTDQIVAIWLKAKLNMPDWRELIKKKLQGNEEIFRHFAQELLEENYETT